MTESSAEQSVEQSVEHGAEHGAESTEESPATGDAGTPDSIAPGPVTERAAPSASGLERESEIAADYLEELLDIADLDGDIDMDIERRSRGRCPIVGGDLDHLVGSRGRGPRRAAGAHPARRSHGRPASAAG